MTPPFAPRPGFGPVDQAADACDTLRSDDRPPQGAVTLAELISDSGPLPADAALECVQRLAERLISAPDTPHERLGPSDVLIDDDGGVWLSDRATSERATGRPDPAEGMDRIGRLLAFLTTGDDRHLAAEPAIDAADLPAPLSTVAGRLFSRNGTCYLSYADLARDAAELRGTSPIATAPAAARAGTRVTTVGPTPNADAVAVDRGTTAVESSGAKFAMLAAASVAIGAAIAYAVWQWL